MAIKRYVERRQSESEASLPASRSMWWEELVYYSSIFEYPQDCGNKLADAVNISLLFRGAIMSTPELFYVFFGTRILLVLQKRLLQV